MEPTIAQEQLAADLSFEQAFEQLETIVRQLEEGGLGLEEALALYERGMALAALCSQRLDQAELRVRQLLTTASGEVAAEPFGGWPET